MFCVNFGSPRVLQQISTTQLDRTLVLLKERKKKMRRYGSFLQHYADRDMFYNLMGGPKGSLILVERVPDRKNYIHHLSRHEQYHIRVVKRRNNAYDGMGAVRHHQMWDGTHNSVNPLFDGALRVQWRGVDKDNAIAMFERWGVRGIVMDDVFKANQGDVKYFKHRLYMYNFPWIRDPVTNSLKGDADWSWKGEDKIDYSSYGASTPDSRNDFTSLWRDAVATHGADFAASKPVVENVKPSAAKPVKEAEAPKAAEKKVEEAKKVEAPKKAEEAKKVEEPKKAAEVAAKEEDAAPKKKKTTKKEAAAAEKESNKKA